MGIFHQLGREKTKFRTTICKISCKGHRNIRYSTAHSTQVAYSDMPPQTHFNGSNASDLPEDTRDNHKEAKIEKNSEGAQLDNTASIEGGPARQQQGGSSRRLAGKGKSSATWPNNISIDSETAQRDKTASIEGGPARQQEDSSGRSLAGEGKSSATWPNNIPVEERSVSKGKASATWPNNIPVEERSAGEEKSRGTWPNNIPLGEPKRTPARWPNNIEICEPKMRR